MKLTKKIVAAVAAFALAMSSMTGIFADEISGDANYVNETVYKVTLPTTQGMKFTLDPQGLVGLQQSGSKSAAGVISGTGLMVAKSESSVDVKLSAKFYVTAPSTLTVTDAAVAATSTAEAIQLQIEADDSQMATASVTTPTAATISGTTTNVTGTSLSAPSEYTVTMTKVAYVTTYDAATAKFKHIKDTSANETSYVFMGIKGTVAGKHDWSKYADGTNKIILNAVFSFKSVDGEAIDAAGGNTYSVANGTTMSFTRKNVTAVAYGTAADGAFTAIATSNYTVNTTTKTVAIKGGIFPAAAVGKTRYIRFTYPDTTTEVFPVVITQ